MKTDSLLGCLFFFLKVKKYVSNNRAELHSAVQTHTSYPNTRNSGELIEFGIQSVVQKTL